MTPSTTPSVTPSVTSTSILSVTPTRQALPTTSLFIQASVGAQTGNNKNNNDNGHQGVFISGVLFIAVGISVLIIA